MADERKDTQKIRFKFANGEEFEAEGTLDFVEKQRDYFLSLVKKKPLTTAVPRPAVLRGNSPAEDTSVSGTLTPRLYATAPGSYASDPKATPTARTPRPVSPEVNINETNAFSGERLWEQLLAEEGGNLYLRRKFHLSADEAALILLAGGKELLRKDGCSALWLGRALEKSGFSVGRLDRLLSGAMKLSLLLCQGSKRSRLYILTPAGFARAFVLAQKKVPNLL